MKQVSIEQAMDTFSALIREVEGGARIAITRDGEPVADIVPYQPKTKKPAAG